MLRKTRLLPLLPLRDIIVFPHMVVPLFVGRERSIAALSEAMAKDKEVLLSAQKHARTNEPSPDEIFTTGTVGSIIQLLRLPDGTVKVLVEGKRRASIRRFIQNDDFFLCEIEELRDQLSVDAEIEALMRTVRTSFELYVKLNRRIPPELLASISAIAEPSRLADTISAHLAIKLNDKQQLLETVDPKLRLERLHELMQAEIEIMQVERKIKGRVKKQMDKSQRDFYLNEQMQAIQKELGERDEFKSELDELEEKLNAKPMSEEASAKAKKELRKLKMMSPMSAEATVVRNYIDWILSLPWEERTQDKLEINEASAILEADHYGLKKPKERIIEYLAVQALVEVMRGPILCLVGPPGVGKTSLARSISRATGRNFVRVSLGGVRDEAEIRGHRRTYIGAMPGKIIQCMKTAGSCNPVFLLDEVDKMSMDFRGDPSSALLEVLDPEQNAFFNDHYLDLNYDLSKVLFIATANNLHAIPIPLKDRMEIIEISGYTEFEKLNIARNYLVPRQAEQNGIKDIDVNVSDAAIRAIINHYTMEAGVRSLEREISSISRKIACDVVRSGKDQSFRITSKLIPKYLGPFKFKLRQAEERDEIGMTNGLAVTMFGGTMLKNEVTLMPGKGKLIITGQLRDVMQESAQAAMSYVRSRAVNLGLSPDFVSKVDIHIHFPGDHIPKDGPSAGITMATSIVSALTRIPVRRDVAMTGEITLRGRVLPIGGLREKLLAAHRGGIKRVIIPIENRGELREVPKRVRKALELILVENMDEVLMHVLRLDDADAFRRNLSKPILPPDIVLRPEPSPPLESAPVTH
ncbi:MAG: endopeptidase La [Myxococcota bacterium]|jgi:ATP-dependent Lon protease|nr:endopeptidase La [Myxococcota bacterium]